MTDAPRTCADCPADISARHFNAKRCEPCAQKVKQAGIRRWRGANPDKERVRRRVRRAANPEKTRESDRRYRAANPEKVREWTRRRPRASIDKARERTRRWREANTEKVREYGRRWHAANTEKRNEMRRRRYAANPEVARGSQRRRKPRIGGAKPRRYRFLLYVIQGGICGICLKDMTDFGAGMHVDHIIPLALGGPDIFANWQAAHAFCNLSKGDSGRPLPGDVRRSIQERMPFMPPIDEQIADVLDIEADSRVR